MTNIRTIVGSALHAVNNAVTSVSGVVSAASGGIDMLNQYVEAASLDQRERQVAHRVSMRQRLLRDTKIEIARGNAEVVRFCEESQLNKSLFDEADKLVAEAFSRYDN